MPVDTVLIDHVRQRMDGAVRARDSAGGGAQSPLVLEPRDAAHAAEMMAWLSAEGIPVRPVGGGSRSPAGVIWMSTARMDRIVEHEPADLVIGVEAGLPLRRLHAALEQVGQVLTLDPPVHPDGTIGAVVARADAGPLETGYGGVRDLALGAEVVTGDGRILHFGGRVVKNVAGYDGVRLLVGSAGALGLVTRCFLRVRGRPAADATAAFSWSTPEAALAAAQAVHSRVQVEALELFTPPMAAAAGMATAWTALFRLQGGRADVEDRMNRITEQVRRSTGSPTPIAPDVWSRLAAVDHTASSRWIARHTAMFSGLILSRMGSATASVRIARGEVRVIDVGGREEPPAGPGSAAGADWLAELTEGAATAWLEQDGVRRPVARPPGDRPQSDPADGLRLRLCEAFDPAGILHPRREVL